MTWDCAIIVAFLLVGGCHFSTSNAQTQQVGVGEAVDQGTHNSTTWASCAQYLVLQHHQAGQLNPQEVGQQQGGKLQQALQPNVQRGQSLPPQQPQQPDVLGLRQHHCAKLLYSHLHTGFEYMVPLRERVRGHAMEGGDRERIRAAFHKLVTGQPFKVVLLGGSITTGVGAIHLFPEKAWGMRLESWLVARFPNVSVLNMATAGTPSNYMALCVKAHCPSDVDLVILEYAINDVPYSNDIQSHGSYERLVRKLLNYPNRPAVAILNAFGWVRYGGVWWSNAEAAYLDMGLFYGLPVISVKGAFYETFRKNITGFRVDNVTQALPVEEGKNFFFFDDVHPYGETGHRAYADLVIHFFMHNMRDVVMRPVHPAELEVLKEPLRAPVIPGNWATSNNTCFMSESLKDAVVGREGFEWMNDARPGSKPKWGFISNVTGSSIKFAFTMVSSGAAQPSDMKWVQLAYLRSYEHMGRANVTCEAGCSCVPSIIEGHDAESKLSQTHIHKTDVMPTGSGDNTTSTGEAASTIVPDVQYKSHVCVIVVTVLPDTSSGERKVKLLGLIVGEDTGSSWTMDPVTLTNFHDVAGEDRAGHDRGFPGALLKD